MKTFTDRELRFIRRLAESPVDATVEWNEPCPLHSVCTPLPVFRAHRESEDAFAAEWNTHHRRGPRQSFRFDEVLPAGYSASTR